MIYEFRTYTLKPGSLPEVEKRFGDGYEHRKQYSPLAAFWHTEIGPLNQIVHVWPYASHEERARIRAEAAKDANWPPKIAEFVTAMESEILVPFPFSPRLEPAKLGPFYELRYYTIRPGTLPALIERWGAALPERVKLSPLAVAGHIEHGVANRYIHVWPYRTLDERARIRDEARQMGVWPPKGGSADTLLTQANKILVPSAFSPMQ